ncbi:MAG: hypothetical protein OHK0022_26320 [Roseiflexaceae bacterium]
MAATEITPKTFEKVQMALPLVARVIDIFRPEECIRVEWTPPDYTEIVILWGIITIKRGARQTFIIKGKPAFCAAVIAELRRNGQITNQMHLPPAS